MKKVVRRALRKNKNSARILVLSFVAVIITAVIGSLFTNAATDSWYQSIKPAITPPNFVFPIAWTILYILIAFSIWLSIINSSGKARKLLISLFAINLILNALWSILFFGMHLPVLSFIDLALMWLSIIVLIKTTWKVSKTAAWLLLPYACWVTFAGLLNYLIAF